MTFRGILRRGAWVPRRFRFIIQSRARCALWCLVHNRPHALEGIFRTERFARGRTGPERLALPPLGCGYCFPQLQGSQASNKDVKDDNGANDEPEPKLVE